MKKNVLYFLLAILFGILLGVASIYIPKIRKNYVAVFLNNGAVYFGKLSTFPRLKLTNALFVQLDQNGQVSLQRFSEVFWMPLGPIYLNRDAILLIAPLNKSSPLINLIEGRSIQRPIQQPPSQQFQPPQIPLNSATSSQ